MTKYNPYGDECDDRLELRFDGRGRLIAAMPKTDTDLERWGENGRRRTKQTNPYNYDPFTIWGHAGPNEDCTGTEWTDRLSSWDYNKYQALAAKHYAGIRPFDSHHCKGEAIQEFLRDWYDDPTLVLLRVIEYCNASSGFPTWRLDYKRTDSNK